MKTFGTLVLLIGVALAACGGGDDGEAERAVAASSTTSPLVVTSTVPATTQPATTTVAPVPETSAPTTDAPIELDPAAAEGVEVATRFMHAFADHDMDTINETAVEGHVFGVIAVDFDLFPTEFAWRDAVGWEITVDECSPTYADPSYVKVTCWVTHDSTWGRALGTGPYEGEYYIRVDLPGGDGPYGQFDSPTVTQRTFARFPTGTFDREIMSPFLDWVETEYPEHIDLMVLRLGPGDLDILPELPVMNPESIDLWRRHTEEFAAASA